MSSTPQTLRITGNRSRTAQDAAAGGGGTSHRGVPLESLSERLIDAGGVRGDLERELDAKRSQLDAARTMALDAKGRMLAAMSDETHTREAHALLIAVSDSTRQVVRKKLEQLVTLALRAVFKSGARFRLETSMSRGAVTCVPQVGYLKQSPKLKHDPKSADSWAWYPLSEVGGGVVDVVAFALRVALLSMYRPKLRQVLVADEPFKHVSDNYLPAVAAMLRELSHAAGLQLIIVSHESELAGAADKVIEIAHGVKGGIAQSYVLAGDEVLG